MNERMKILEMLSAGKITTEQADQLLSTLDAKTKRSSDGPRFTDKFTLPDLKNIGSQVTAAVSQSLGDVKRVVEQQLDNWSFNSSTVSVTHELSLPLEVMNISAETTNGKIQVFHWDEPFAKIDIRAQMRTNSLADGKKALVNALQISHVHQNYELAVVHGRKDNEAHALVSSAHLDLYVPKHLTKVHVRTQNGGISVDSVRVSDLQTQTTNGGISLYKSGAARLHVETENGAIEIQNGIPSSCRNVYAYTKNGRLVVQGLPVDSRCVGTARTNFGKIDIRHPGLVVEFDDSERKTFARFRPAEPEADSDETRLHLETRNGSIHIHA
jgi:hypothetical protein